MSAKHKFFLRVSASTIQNVFFLFRASRQMPVTTFRGRDLGTNVDGDIEEQRQIAFVTRDRNWQLWLTYYPRYGLTNLCSRPSSVEDFCRQTHRSTRKWELCTSILYYTLLDCSVPAVRIIGPSRTSILQPVAAHLWMIRYVYIKKSDI